jgi:hypothetical protein
MTLLPPVRAQLLDAAERRSKAGRQTEPKRGRPWRRPLRVAGIVIFLALAGGSAAAAAGLWQPVLGRPELDNTPQGVSEAPIPRNARDMLGVLRRPQSAADRGSATRALLRHAGSESSGVRLDSVRLVTLSNGSKVAVFSEEKSVDPASGSTEIAEPVCILLAHGGACASIADIRARGLVVFLGRQLLGLVPDGVASVALDYSDGNVLREDVHDNIYTLLDALPSISPPDPGDTHPSASSTPRPLADGMPTSVRWLDGNGHTISSHDIG